MRTILSQIFLIISVFSFAQKSEYFKNVEFDSSYAVIGIVQGFDKQDSLPQYWFILDDPPDMNQLKKDWVFKKEVPHIGIEFTPIEIYTLRNKMEAIPTSLIYPMQGIIRSGNKWYEFDMKEVEKLHRKHPLHYRTQTFLFDTYKKCILFGNSLMNDSNVLFFQPPNLKFEGKFYIYANRTNDNDSPMWAMSDINKTLKTLADENTYESGNDLNDTFNIAHKDQTRITISGPKSLYDKFESTEFKKGDWIPTPIDMKVFWRD